MKDEYRASRIWSIVEAALEYFISIMLSGAYLARVTSALGFSDSLTGIVSSFVSMGCVFQLASIPLFRNVASVKRPVIFCRIINQLMFAMVYLTPVIELSSGAKTALFLVCFCGAHLLKNLLASQTTDWLMSLVDDHSRGAFTANKEIVSLLSGMAFTYVMGSLIDHMEATGRQREAFFVGAVTIFLLMVAHTVCMILIKDKPRVAAGPKSAGMLAFLKDKMLIRLVMVNVLWHVASCSATPFYGAYQIKELGFSMTFISVLSIMYSIVRALVSPWMGRYADRHSFSRMVYLCFMIAGAGFLVNCFTAPGNGKVFYAVYYCLYAISMAGINSSITNLIFDYIHGENRRSALAFNAALGGLAGFAATCAMSPVVDWIQKNGNRILGIAMYPAQFVSAVAFVLTAALVVYVRVMIIGAKKAEGVRA